VETQAVVDNT